ncbi:MAG: ComF family protein [Pirellulaceae bacterium]|jgi:ComF family protein
MQTRSGYTVASSLLEMLLPSACSFCFQRFPAGKSPTGLCESCASQFFPIRRTCVRCSARLPETTLSLDSSDCIHCRGEDWHFDRAICAGDYQGPLREAVILMKRPFHEHLALAVGRALGERLRDQIPMGIAAVIPTPQHWRRRILRRTNSSELLAEALAGHLGIPIRRILRRTRATAKQGMLTGAQRRVNLRNAFDCTDCSFVAGKTLLLVDDILTSGATANSMALALRKAGAGAIHVVTVARSLGLPTR